MVTSNRVRPSMTTSWLTYPTYEKTRIAFSFGTMSRKEPSEEDAVPDWVSLIMMLTPGSPSPFSSTTRPEISISIVGPPVSYSDDFDFFFGIQLLSIGLIIDQLSG